MTTDKNPYLAGPEAESSRSALPDFREAITIIIERAWLGLLVALCVFLAFWLNAHRQTPYYRSTAMIMVEAQIPQLFSFQEAMSFNSRNLEYFNTHIKALHSYQMIERAIVDGGLSTRAGFTPGISPGEGQVGAALRFVTISPVEKSRIIEITAEHPDPQIASDLANALAGSYIRQDLSNRMSASLQAVDWLKARAEESRASLEQALLKLQEYRESTQSVSLEDDQNIVIAKLKTLNNALTEVQTQRIDAEAQCKEVNKQVDGNAPLSAVVSILQDPEVQDAESRLRAHQQQMEIIKKRYLPGHPDYQAALDEEEKLTQGFEQVCKQATQAMNSRYELLVEREQSLQKALQKQEQEAFDLDRKLVRYNELKRDAEAEKEVYNALVARMKEASLSGSLPSELIRVSEEARPAHVPFRPNPKRAMLQGGLLGVALGLFSIFAVYFADHRFRRIEEVERQLGIPVIGTIPLISVKTLAERGLVVKHQNTSEAAESFRMLRARMLMNASGCKKKILMITSAHANEGKSLTATNLAVSFAQNGQRILLVGADLRRPSLHKIFEVSEKLPGLADVLKGDADWRIKLMKHDIPGLDVLPAGEEHSRPAELLGSSRLRVFLNEVIELYDCVVLDAPPIIGVSDSLILLSHVDSILFVVRYGVTHSLSAGHALRRVRDSERPCCGIVMNGVNLHSLASYYQYRRYGRYAYHSQAESGAPAGKKENR